MTKNALAIRCLGATMPTGELLLSRRFSPQRVLQLFTLQLSTSPAPLYSRSETESAPGWGPNSQDDILQGLEEKSQEPITMGSWPRSWLPSQSQGAFRCKGPAFRCKGPRERAERVSET